VKNIFGAREFVFEQKLNGTYVEHTVPVMEGYKSAEP
jgi:hypothetical protein